MSDELATRYPWYEVVSDTATLEQGDILDNWTLHVPLPEAGIIEPQSYTLILMTQSCDIEDDIPHLVFCPLWTAAQLAKTDATFGKPATIGNLLRGRVTGFFAINKCELTPLERDWRIVQFQRIIELERRQVVDNPDLTKPRLRLLPPYRESLSQAFARFFMRVGVPVPVDNK